MTARRLTWDLELEVQPAERKKANKSGEKCKSPSGKLDGKCPERNCIYDLLLSTVESRRRDEKRETSEVTHVPQPNDRLLS